MPDYYSTIIFFSWIALAVLCILVWENNRIAKADKGIYYLTCLLIALSALAEWVAVKLDGNESIPRWVITAVKTSDFILTPLAGGTIMAQMRPHNIGHKITFGLLAFNTAFQLVAAVMGWMTALDAHNVYSPGPLYPVYIGVYALLLVLMVIEFILYGRSFRRQNRKSLYGIMLVILSGIVFQELSRETCRIVYLGMTVGAIMLFIHYVEFMQIESDDKIHEQERIIMTDVLTGVKSRHAYIAVLKEHEENGTPSDLTVFMADINGLKQCNDSYGHEAGDELLVGAAKCISETLGQNGETYRVGGDEFIVLSHMTRQEAEAAVQRLQEKTAAWSGEKVKKLGITAGFAMALEHPGLSTEDLVKAADQKMYIAKTLYYSSRGT